jgi:hypothetical protein
VPSDQIPPIPSWLAGRPTVGGLVVPWTTPQTQDGRYVFGSLHPRFQDALKQRLCGVCGGPLTRPMVLLMRLSDLPFKATSEPALHPQCSRYTTLACPMVAGHRAHYRSTPVRLDSSMTYSADVESRLGAPAEPWFAAWLNRYDVIELNGDPAASYREIEPLRIRPINFTFSLFDLLR